jgi:hypothetical protein
MRSSREGTPATEMPLPPHDERQAHVAAMARMIRQLFVFRVRGEMAARTGKADTWGDSHVFSRDGGRDRRGKVHASIWEQIARSCLEHRLDPTALVETHFETNFVLMGLPRPGALLGAAALRRYRDYDQDCGWRMGLAWNAQMQHLEVEAGARESLYRESPEVAAFYILASPLAELSGLFRYCVAWQADNAALRAMFRWSALEHYISKRYAYDRGWGDWIPSELRAEADAFFEQRT